MRYSKKKREKAVQGLKKLNNDGTECNKAVSAISELTGTPRDLLDSWLAVEEAKRKNHLSPSPASAPEKINKLKDFRDQRFNRGETPCAEDLRVEELQKKYLADTYGF